MPQAPFARSRTSSRRRERPDSLTYGTAGVGSAGHIAKLLLARASGIRATHVPFNGSAAVATALLGRQIDIATAYLDEAIGFARGTEWRILGVMAPTRSSAAPDVPTFAEAGLLIETGSLRGLGAPRDLPAATLAEILRVPDAAMADPEYRAAMAQASQTIRYVPAPEYEALLRAMEASLCTIWLETPGNR